MKASKEKNGFAGWLLAAALMLSGEAGAQENQAADGQQSKITVPVAEAEPALSDWEMEVLAELDLIENLELLERIELADYLDLFGKED